MAGLRFSGNVVLAVVLSVLTSLRYSSDSEQSEDDEMTITISNLTRIGARAQV